MKSKKIITGAGAICWVPETYKGYYIEWFDLHRENGPAFLRGESINHEILEAWYLYGKPHRINGAAQLFKDHQYWNLHGVIWYIYDRT